MSQKKIKFESSEDLLIYNRRINYYKNKREKFRLLETGKEIGECLNIKDLQFMNGYNHTRINILSTMINLINQLDSTNMNIIEVNEIKDIILPDGINFNNTLSNTFYISRMKKLIEYIIFDMHKFISQMIAITWIISYPNEKKFLIYDIGSYLNIRDKQQNKNEYTNIKFCYFDEYKNFFQDLNNLINSYKHSPTTNESNVIGQNDIVVIAYKMRDDSIFKDSKLYIKYLNDLIANFNMFFINTKSLMDELTKKV